MSDILEKVSNIVSKIGFQLKKHGPDIMVAAGALASIGSTVLACRATVKAQPVLEEHKEQLEELKKEQEESDCSEKEKNRQVAKLYLETGWKLTKLYGPSVLLGAAGIGCSVGSHKIMLNRNAATAAAYTVLSEAVSQYREKVKGQVGEDEEKKLWGNRQALPTPEDAPEVDENKKLPRDRQGKYGPYARVFDEANEGWNENPELTMYYLKMVETQANNLLQSRGHLFLNEVYDLLGYERSKIGQYVGWIDDPKDPSRACHVDFGLYDIRDKMKRRFINGYEPNVWLDFNVDGVIVNDIPDSDSKYFK